MIILLQDEEASFSEIASCCSDMEVMRSRIMLSYTGSLEVIFIQPRSPPSNLHRDLAPPRLDTAFYTDLGARAITAVEEMKKVRMMMMMMIMIMIIIRLGAGLRWSM